MITPHDPRRNILSELLFEAGQAQENFETLFAYCKSRYSCGCAFLHLAGPRPPVCAPCSMTASAFASLQSIGPGIDPAIFMPEPGKTHIVFDALSDPACSFKPIPLRKQSARFCACAGLPCGSLRGCLCLASCEPMHPEPEEIEHLGLLAQACADRLDSLCASDAVQCKHCLFGKLDCACPFRQPPPPQQPHPEPGALGARRP